MTKEELFEKHDVEVNDFGWVFPKPIDVSDLLIISKLTEQHLEGDEPAVADALITQRLGVTMVITRRSTAWRKHLGLLDEGAQFYWCGWTEPDEVPDEHMVESWPNNMKGWHTGSGMNFITWAGIVWALSPDDAWRTVLSCYGDSANQIEERWEPEARGTKWTGTAMFPATKEQIEQLKGGT